MWTWMNDLVGFMTHFGMPWAVFGAILGIPLVIFMALAVSSECQQLAAEDAADAAASDG